MLKQASTKADAESKIAKSRKVSTGPSKPNTPIIADPKLLGFTDIVLEEDPETSKKAGMVLDTAVADTMPLVELRTLSVLSISSDS